MTIRCFEAFAGIGAQAEALKELGLDYEVVGISEIDKHAIRGYEAIHGPVNNYGDITKIEHLPECDLLTYSYPCTSVSVAGRQEGMKEGSGTASSLLWEVGRLLKDMQDRGVLPEVLLMENVDAVLNQRNINDFKRWLTILSDMGYTNSYTIMNAKDYGTPQNRRRIFMVSTLTLGEFVFPEPCPDGRVLRDVLEKDVPESYFLSEKRLATFQRHKERNDAKGNGFSFQIRDLENVACAITTNADRYTENWVEVSKNDVQNDIGIEKAGELTDSNYAESKLVMGQNGVSRTITAEHPRPNMPKVIIDDKKQSEVIVEGKVDSSFKSEQTVLSDKGVSKAITAQDNGTVSKIVVEGSLNVEGWHKSTNEVFGTDGVSPTIVAQSNNTKTKIVVPDIEIKGKLNEKGHFDCIQRVYGKDGASPTVTDHVPMMEDDD